jgi:hypothetical protein
MYNKTMARMNSDDRSRHTKPGNVSMLTSDQLDTAKLQLAEWGLCLVGKSEKSQSTYWSLTEDDNAKRLRLSDHAVAHACSDCAVCVGDSADDDFGIDRLREAVSALVAVQLAADEATYREDWSDDEDLEAMIASNAAKIRSKWEAFLGGN